MKNPIRKKSFIYVCLASDLTQKKKQLSILSLVLGELLAIKYKFSVFFIQICFSLPTNVLI